MSSRRIGIHDRRGGGNEEEMKTHGWTIVTVFLSALAGGATFLLALFRQYGLVEAAASLRAGLEVFFLSSSIGDLVEDRKEPNRIRVVAAIGLAAGGRFLFDSKTDTRVGGVGELTQDVENGPGNPIWNTNESIV
jgi:hypothetical protein